MSIDLLGFLWLYPMYPIRPGVLGSELVGF